MKGAFAPLATARQWCSMSWKFSLIMKLGFVMWNINNNEYTYLHCKGICWIKTQADHCQRVSNKTHINTRLIHNKARGVVLCCHHGDGFLLFVQALDGFDGYFGSSYRAHCKRCGVSKYSYTTFSSWDKFTLRSIWVINGSTRVASWLIYLEMRHSRSSSRRHAGPFELQEASWGDAGDDGHDYQVVLKEKERKRVKEWLTEDSLFLYSKIFCQLLCESECERERDDLDDYQWFLFRLRFQTIKYRFLFHSERRGGGGGGLNLLQEEGWFVRFQMESIPLIRVDWINIITKIKNNYNVFPRFLHVNKGGGRGGRVVLCIM